MGSSAALTTLAPVPVPVGVANSPSHSRRSIKVVLIGDGGTGKTSLRNHFLSGTFSANYRATIGADFITRTMPLHVSSPEGERVSLQIWDTAGQERFQSLGSAFYRGADAVVIALDLTKPESLDRVRAWYNAFMDKAPGPSNELETRRFCWICAANKADLPYSIDRSTVRNTLHAILPSPSEQPDFGDSPAVPVEQPEQPANPQDVLRRPDPPFATPYGSISTIAGLASPPLAPCGPGLGPRDVPARRGHQKRGSVRSIAAVEAIPFPTSGAVGAVGMDRSRSRSRMPAVPSMPSMPSTPPRQRVDSTLSLAASSVYHTPRSSAYLGSSPTPVSSIVPERTLKMSFSTTTTTTTSTASTATAKPPPPAFGPGPGPGPAPTVTIGAEPPAAELEEGFTLFFTSAKTGENVERLFRHVVDRVAASWAAQEALLSKDHHNHRHDAQDTQEAVRRAIRISAGKEPNPRRGLGLASCCT